MNEPLFIVIDPRASKPLELGRNFETANLARERFLAIGSSDPEEDQKTSAAVAEASDALRDFFETSGFGRTPRRDDLAT
jgi:hypothetical protein